jgi:hypothetical protein
MKIDEKQRSFESRGRTVNADRGPKLWMLALGDHEITTRDLSAGIEELLGTSRTNLPLALRIMEADAKDAR